MSNRNSDSWRSQGNRFASDYGQWEFHSRTLFAGALACSERHLAAHEKLLQEPDGPAERSDLILILPAHLLAANGLLAQIARQFAQLSLSANEHGLLERLGTVIEWAGRYPIPKWSAEKHRQKYDVTLRGSEGEQYIDAREIPGAVSHETWYATVALIEKLQEVYTGRGQQPRPA